MSSPKPSRCGLKLGPRIHFQRPKKDREPKSLKKTTKVIQGKRIKEAAERMKNDDEVYYFLFEVAAE